MIQGAKVNGIPKEFKAREAEVRAAMIMDKILQTPPEMQAQLLDALIQRLEGRAEKGKPLQF